MLRVPVFVVGAPRSGTTLLRVTLDRHPQLAMWRGESAFFQRLYARRAAFGGPGNPRNRERIISTYLATAAVRSVVTDLEVLRERMMREGVSWRALFATMLETCADLQGKPYAGEKTPIRAFHVDTLCDWFPGCSIIHIVRDPRDVVSSLIRMPWANRSVVAGAHAWHSFNMAARAGASRDNYLLVKYEELVSQAEDQLRRISSHVGLPFHEALLEARPVKFAHGPVTARAHEGITTTRVELWRRELKPWQVAAIEKGAGRGMDEFGYQRESKSQTVTDWAKATGEALVEVAFHKVSRIPCAYYHYFHPTNLVSHEKWIGR